MMRRLARGEQAMLLEPMSLCMPKLFECSLEIMALLLESAECHPKQLHSPPC
jgi:hypothetical protein